LLVPGFYLPIWSARLSILFTIIRIIPWPKQRKVLAFIAAFFIFQCAFLHAQVIWECEESLEWTLGDPFCPLGKFVPITQITTALVSDVILIATPLWMLRTILTDPRLRSRLVIVFSVSVVTTLAALGHSISIIFALGVTDKIFAAIEIAVAMTVCNATVVTPVILRWYRNRKAVEETNYPTTVTSDAEVFLTDCDPSRNAVSLDAAA